MHENEPIDSTTHIESSNNLAKEPNISDKTLEKFITHAVNAGDELTDGSNQYFFERYKKFFPSVPKRREIVLSLLPIFRRKWTSDKGLVEDELPTIYYRSVIGELRDGLRAIWEAEDEYTAAWRLFHLHYTLHRLAGATDKPQLQPPPIHAPIHQAIHWLGKRFTKLRKCANPDCKAPFFVADRGTRRYCSDLCSDAGQLEVKRRWFREHGAQWRAKRKRQNTKRSKSNRG